MSKSINPILHYRSIFKTTQVKILYTRSTLKKEVRIHFKNMFFTYQYNINKMYANLGACVACNIRREI